ncbi:hypothetical protein [Rhodococcus opacus]|uniref:hypothetical protein n=1 Tax=Rhodococcus opacus TaxID=37919 RepID=UPI00294A6994|nr:hypothetical protein [Rhodococcus opacus]MDV6244902.1 hypothetical protein [Rhodococcus opacus]
MVPLGQIAAHGVGRHRIPPIRGDVIVEAASQPNQCQRGADADADAEVWMAAAVSTGQPCRQGVSIRFEDLAEELQTLGGLAIVVGRG